MKRTTRSCTSSPVKKAPAQAPAENSKLQREPRKHFVLPKDVSDGARLILLQHPRDSSVQRFLFCPEEGLFQFTKISTSSADPRSLLFVNSEEQKEQSQAAESSSARATGEILSDGYLSESADLFVATPFDLAFILIPLVTSTKAPTGKQLFQPLDDILEQHTQEDKELRFMFQNGRALVEEAMSRFCDIIGAGEEQMYRPNEEKTLRMILDKVQNVIGHGLPASLEEKYVTRALEAPILSVKREETANSTKSESDPQDETDPSSDSLDSQSSAASSAPSAIFSEASATSSVSTIVTDAVSEELRDLQKQSTVLDFILASCVPTTIAGRLKERFASEDGLINFTPLEEHLQSLAVLRAEALASRSIGDFGRKRGLDDEEAADLRAEKKRKQDEEEKKKKLGESRGVRDLKKVNVSGMKKMSDFFAKKPATKAS